jgi:hypothetical protein
MNFLVLLSVWSARQINRNSGGLCAKPSRLSAQLLGMASSFPNFSGAELQTRPAEGVSCALGRTIASGWCGLDLI